MHPRVEALPKPSPDVRRFLQVLRRERPDRVPMIELAIDAGVVATLLDEPPLSADFDPCERVRRDIRLMHRLGYDVVKVSANIPFDVQRLQGDDGSALSSGARQWADQHKGAVDSMEAFDRFTWPEQRDIDFSGLEAGAASLPDGMGLIAFSGGVLEFTMDLIGMERFMYATYDAPDLIAGVFDRVGRTVLAAFEVAVQMDAVRALWLGDDMGSKNGMLVSPDLIRQHVTPWYKRFVELAHEHGKPFMLHSCGKTDAIMPALLDDVGIDAKHSFEDAIQPVERFYDQWHDRIAVLGGVDVNLLSTGDEDAIRRRTREIIEHCAPGGGYAVGSGNSIPNYVSPMHYMAMVEASHEAGR